MTTTKSPRRAVATPIAYFGYSLSAATNQEDVFTVDPATGRIRRLTHDRGPRHFVSDRDPAWSPDRRTIAIHRASTVDTTSRIVLIDAGSGRDRTTLVEGACPEWFDANRVLFLRSSSVEDPATGVSTAWWTDVWAVDVTTLATTRLTDLSPHGCASHLSWHPTAGLALSYTEQVPDLPFTSAVVTVSAAQVAATLAGGAVLTAADLVTRVKDAAEPDWSPEGDRLAHVHLTQVPYPDPEPGQEGATLAVADVAVTDLASGVTVMITDDGGAGAYAPDIGGSGPAFSPDGTQVAFVRGDEDAWTEIWLAAADGSSPPRRLTDEHRRWFKGALDW